MRLCELGFADPRIIEVAKLFPPKNWRVTSVFRFNDGSAHSRGTALDVAPMIARRGPCYFDMELARLILLFLKRHFPDLSFRVVSESDHVHIELSSKDSFGTWYPPELKEHDLQEAESTSR